MAEFQIWVENISCSGCQNSISKKLKSIAGVEQVKVNIESGQIDISANDSFNEQEAVQALRKMGYPQKGESNSVLKAKSYVSCAIGKISGE